MQNFQAEPQTAANRDSCEGMVGNTRQAGKREGWRGMYYGFAG